MSILFISPKQRLNQPTEELVITGKVITNINMLISTSLFLYRK